MKKFLIAAVVLLSSISLANAEKFRMGVTVKGGVFSADGASENFTGNHSGNRATTDVTKSSDAEGEDAEAAVMMGSIFLEGNVNDKFSLGINYVPHSMDSETTENTQNMHAVKTGEDTSSVRNTVKVSFEDLTTVYALIDLENNIYAKIGYTQVEIITDENLGTGGAYGNTDMDGFTVGIGYSMDLADGAFVRAEASYMDLSGVTVTNDNDSQKSVSVDGITGFGAGVSIGKSF